MIAKPTDMPGFIRPRLAILKSEAPKGDLWPPEIKYDGVHVQIHINKGKRKVFTPQPRFRGSGGRLGRRVCFREISRPRLGGMPGSASGPKADN